MNKRPQAPGAVRRGATSLGGMNWVSDHWGVAKAPHPPPHLPNPRSLPRALERKVKAMQKTKGYRGQKNFGTGTPMHTKSRRRKQASSPWGDEPRSQRVAAVLGSKPNAFAWHKYHAIAQKSPWSLDKMRADRAPLALSARLVLAPDRTLNAYERAAIAEAYRALAAGRVDAAGYFAMLDRLGAGIIPAKRGAK